MPSRTPRTPRFEDQKVQFLTNVKGYVDGLAVPMEPRLKPIVFSKQPEARLSDAAYLKQYVGAYELAGQTVNMRLNGNSLVLDMPGQPSVTLVPIRMTGSRSRSSRSCRSGSSPPRDKAAPR